MLLAGAGIALTGVVPGYWVIFSVVAMSGIGIAAFHPEAARLANLVAGDKKGTSMSIFATGGQLGFVVGDLYYSHPDALGTERHSIPLPAGDSYSSHICR